jgi:hypothetical protein
MSVAAAPEEHLALEGLADSVQADWVAGPGYLADPGWWAARGGLAAAAGRAMENWADREYSGRATGYPAHPGYSVEDSGW